jgi:hypothetical protein
MITGEIWMSATMLNAIVPSDGDDEGEGSSPLEPTLRPMLGDGKALNLSSPLRG